MGKEDDPPLTPYHIIRGEQHSEAIRADIADLIASARHDLSGAFRSIQVLEESHAVLSMVSIGVLTRLSELGAEEVDEVTSDFLDLDEPDPVMNDLSRLASLYDVRWHEAQESSERERMRKLTVFTLAAFSISVVAVVHSREPAGTAEDSSLRYGAAAEAVHNTSGILSSKSHDALQIALDEVHEDIEMP